MTDGINHPKHYGGVADFGTGGYAMRKSFEEREREREEAENRNAAIVMLVVLAASLALWVDMCPTWVEDCAQDDPRESSREEPPPSIAAVRKAMR